MIVPRTTRQEILTNLQAEDVPNGSQAHPAVGGRREGSGMGGDDRARVMDEAIADGGRFRVDAVGRVSGEPAGIERLEECIDVDQGAARGVHQ